MCKKGLSPMKHLSIENMSFSSRTQKQFIYLTLSDEIFLLLTLFFNHVGSTRSGGKRKFETGEAPCVERGFVYRRLQAVYRHVKLFPKFKLSISRKSKVRSKQFVRSNLIGFVLTVSLSTHAPPLARSEPMATWLATVRCLMLINTRKLWKRLLFGILKDCLGLTFLS